MDILIVDDNAFILEIISKMLAGQGYKIHPKSNVDEAISYLEGGSECDLVITDIVMPEKDGTKLASYVKSKTPSMPVLAMTGGLENALEDYVVLAEMFADEVMTKPFHKNQLIETIERLVA
ncbi:MAG TPA: response regulator [Alphaproteobacteria bacterium]|nr:response regulator [Alphaproteobacteria bacterium]USO05437.1 MAG: response regulator [Rhodospirillales bacterium]HOO81384.1 response regulator [Alphaproteobacteria bacterium]